MGLLQVAVLGSPEVLHNGQRLSFSLRKAQALLLYLSLEGGLHSRGKVAAFLWPDSEPQDARKALRNVIMLLRNLLAHPDAPSPIPDHLLSQHDFLGLDPHQLAQDHVKVLQAYQHVQHVSALPPAEQLTALIAELQQALSLVRGPVLDGFWLGEHAPFDEWLLQQQQQWQVRLHLLYDRLSFWQESVGESEQALMTLTNWLALDPLHEEAYRRLMQAHLTLGDPQAALQVYATARARLAEELAVEPSSETMALAEHVRATMLQPHQHTSLSEPPRAIISPLIGRASAFSLLVDHYQDARQGHPQGVIIQGEAGIGKTRLVDEFVAWARARQADTLIGHVLESGVRLPYQPLVEAMRTRLEEENAPDDLLDDVWLVELSRVLPELRIRYPDLPIPSQDESTDQLRFFEAVAQLFLALARRRPLILFLDDMQWLDSASSDLLHYLTQRWKEQNTPILLLHTVRSEALAMDAHLSVRLADAIRILSFVRITLQPLSQQEVLHLTEAIISGVEDDVHTKSLSARSSPSIVPEIAEGAASTPSPVLAHLARLLFEQTGGHLLYLIETFKLLIDRQWLLPQLSADHRTWRFVLTVPLPDMFTQEQVQHELLAPSIRMMILARLSTLDPATRQLLMAAAVLGNLATAKNLWRVADLPYAGGIEALEQAVKSGLLREMDTRQVHASGYRFAHELERDVLYTEIGEARRHFMHQRALEVLIGEGAHAAELAYHANEAGDVELAYRYAIQAGDDALTVFAVKEAIVYYERARALVHDQVQQTALDLSQKKVPTSTTTGQSASHSQKYTLQISLIEHLYTSLSHAYTFLPAQERALEVYEELLTYARQQHHISLIIDILNRLSMMLTYRDPLDARVDVLMQEAVLMAEKSGDLRVQTITALSLAQIAYLQQNGQLKRAVAYAEKALMLARREHNTELEAKSLHLLGFFSLWQGDFQTATGVLEEALKLYSALQDDPDAPRTYSLLLFLAIGSPSPTYFLRDLATEAVCRGHLALAQLHSGQLPQSLLNARWAVETFKETRATWAQFDSSTWLTHALLETGAYQEAYTVIQQTIAFVQPDQATFYSGLHMRNLRFALARTYQAMQQWEEARLILVETEDHKESSLGAVASWTSIAPFSHLCMHYALREEWQLAHSYALKAMALRTQAQTLCVPLDFVRPYEIDALLHMGEEGLAREEVERMQPYQEEYPRFRIPYLRSLALLAGIDGQPEQALIHLQQAAQLAQDLDLPAERWQIQALLGETYEICGQKEQADAAFRNAASIFDTLAQRIEDAAQRSLFVNTPIIRSGL